MASDLVGDLDSTFWKKGRLETYTYWPFKDATCTPEHLAAAGFYFIGGDDEDAVECVFCGKQLDGWEASDNPWEEHAKHQRDCPFILLNKPDEMKWTIDDFFNLIKVYYARDNTRKMEEVVKHMKLDAQLTAKRIPRIYKAERKSRKGGK